MNGKRKVNINNRKGFENSKKIKMKENKRRRKMSKLERKSMRNGRQGEVYKKE